MIVHIHVQEQGENRNRNTPGGDELNTRVGGSGRGLPFFAFLRSDGDPIVNSISHRADGKPGENIGHPYNPEEVDWFMIMLHKAAPRIAPAESAALEHWLRTQKP